MTSTSIKFPTSFHRFCPSRGQFSDKLIRHVLPRAPGARNDFDFLDKLKSIAAPNNDVEDALLSQSDSYQITATTRPIPSSLRVTGVKRTASISPTKASQMIICNPRTISKRAQRRRIQARYRQKQLNRQLQLEESVERLRHEVDNLKHEHGSLTSCEKPKQCPWTIVAEVSRLLEDSVHFPWRMTNTIGMVNDDNTHISLMFLHACFSSDVTMDDLSGVLTITNHLRRFLLNFGDPELRLERIESMTTSVMIATGRFCATVTELSVIKAFPNLSKRKYQNAGIDNAVLREQLLGQRLNCSCTLTFLLDEQTGCVERLEVNTDFVGALVRVLGNLEDVAAACLDTNSPVPV